MDNRLSVKIIAWIDMVCYILYLVGIGYLAKVAVEYKAASTALWVVVAVALFQVVTQLWAAVMLLFAAGIGHDLNEALGSVRFWKFWTVIFLILFWIGTIGAFVQGIIEPDPSMVSVFVYYNVWRFSTFVCVGRFEKELEDLKSANVGQVQHDAFQSSVTVNI